MTSGWATRIGFSFLAVVAIESWQGSAAMSQDVPLRDTPPTAGDSADAPDDDAPDDAVGPEQGVAEVEQAMDKVEEELEEGLPAAFTIKFGDTYDWMRLTSGEWLKGRLKRMREEVVEFDSDKLDLVKFDWDKVDRLHCPGVNAYVFDDKLDVVGPAVVTPDKILVETSEGVATYKRSELLSIVDGAPRERNWWSSKLGAGFSANAGNTNQGSLNVYFELVRADYRTRTKLRYDGAVGYANNEQNVNRQIGTAEVVLFLSHRFYFTPAGAMFLNDRFQNIKFRATPGAVAGVHIFDTKKWDWNLDVGLGYQYLESVSTAAGVRNPQNDGFASLGTWANLEFVDDVELTLEWRTNFVYTTIGNTNHNGRATFSVEITEIFDFETSFLFLRTEDPLPRADGTIPASNDYQLVVSVALDFD